MAAKYKSIIGRAETIDFIGTPDVIGVPAKIDTGAYSSSVWASNIVEKGGVLEFELMGAGSEFYTGNKVHTSSYKTVVVENSFGKSETRFGVDLRVTFCGKQVTSFFTLADRSTKTYPVLIGRKMLKGRFVVDVSIGHPIASEETEEEFGIPDSKNMSVITKNT